MKKLIFLSLLFCGLMTKAQIYNNLVNYSVTNAPNNGIKIKTNMPFLPAAYMPTITITGYNYESNQSIGLTLSYYIYGTPGDWTDPSHYYFHQSTASSFGAYTPVIKLGAENGKVVIYIEDKVYYMRFTVSAFSIAMDSDPSWFQGWSVADELLTGSPTTEVTYKNRFKGDVYMAGSGVWDSNGNVGIGTITPKERLSVNGTIRAKEIKVEAGGNTWPDYVFDDQYHLTPLAEVEKYIQTNKHLPGIPSAAVIEKEGASLGEMNKKLLEKIEELTLHLIEQEKKAQVEQEKNKQQDRKMKAVIKRLEQLEARQK